MSPDEFNINNDVANVFHVNTDGGYNGAWVTDVIGVRQYPFGAYNRRLRFFIKRIRIQD